MPSGPGAESFIVRVEYRIPRLIRARRWFEPEFPRSKHSQVKVLVSGILVPSFCENWSMVNFDLGQMLRILSQKATIFPSQRLVLTLLHGHRAKVSTLIALASVVFFAGGCLG